MPSPVVQLASSALDDELLRAIAAEVQGHNTLERVVRWGLSQSPAKLVVEVVKQDEYTQDVVVPYANQVHLVYDST